MDLKNGYKVLYEVIEGDNRVFKASRTGNPLDADVIDTIAKGTYKLVYQDADHKLRGSVSGIPAGTDAFLALNNAFFPVEGTESEAMILDLDDNTPSYDTETPSIEDEVETPVEETPEELPQDEEV